MNYQTCVYSSSLQCSVSVRLCGHGGYFRGIPDSRPAHEIEELLFLADPKADVAMSTRKVQGSETSTRALVSTRPQQTSGVQAQMQVCCGWQLLLWLRDG
ncbi:hypothetical protein JMJ77_0001725 [Colletotrichum scovillei]|uniref:Uncharacterized protein n=1 Tax=Colletotrichum scovillei TaxID=1209932 RepID=A0A9P7R8B3_9PEZI|nr:hypothetical protein JMJ77_0001725 [Colletotrichum scovillei]KAG7070133.1 hypothetical protein JMJ76_0001390 [Colletotrichum scovillei]KAG7078381.1 hypothetical protein JMJ78_0002053 [Colletotrichum scovillei]